MVIPDPVTNYPSGDIFDGTGSSGSTGLGSAGSGSTGGGATVVDADDGLGPAPLSHGGHADGASGGLVALPVLHHDAVWLG